MALFATVKKIRPWEKAGDSLHPARHPLDRVIRLGVARRSGCPLHQRQVPARRGAGDAQLFRIYPIILGVVTDVPHGPVHVLEDLWNRELRLAAVDDGENRVTTVEELADKERLDRPVRRAPAAADAD